MLLWVWNSLPVGGFVSFKSPEFIHPVGWQRIPLCSLLTSSLWPVGLTSCEWCSEIQGEGWVVGCLWSNGAVRGLLEENTCFASVSRGIVAVEVLQFHVLGAEAFSFLQLAWRVLR